MNKGLDERGARIKANLEEARRLREEAEALLAKSGEARAAAKETAEMLAHAREEAETPKKEAAANLEAMLKRRERMALDKIAQAEAKALAEVRAPKPSTSPPSPPPPASSPGIWPRSAGALIDQAIGELDKKLHRDSCHR
jgi:F-type H+-transporting ATPase subunit b